MENNESFFEILKTELHKRDNPTKIKSSSLGTIVQLNSLVISVIDKNILLTLGEELQISEWLKFRCNIDAEKKLSELVPQACQDATSITEVHSNSGSACAIPQAISHLANAIGAIKDELLALKCELQVADIVIISSLATDDKYILLDKAV